MVFDFMLLTIVCCRATLLLGFLPQELLGTSMYEYYHHEDVPHLAKSYKAALQSSEKVLTRVIHFSLLIYIVKKKNENFDEKCFTQVYSFRTKEGSFVRLRSEWKSFKNPWTKDIDYLIAKNIAVP